MIKFFRKIRYNLMEQNKIGKYFKYAIGEVVLVVVGIIIALAINEHAKNKNNIDLLNLYLIHLNDELDQNLEELKLIKKITVFNLAELDTLHQILLNKEYDHQKFVIKSTALINIVSFNPIITTYENLKFSGDLKLIKDLDLRNSISKAYQIFNRIKSIEGLDSMVYNVYYQDYVLANARFMNMAMSSENYGKDVYFENTVLSRRVTLRQNRDIYSESIEYLSELKIIFAKIIE